MKIKAYAKLNLILNVLGKRADGYHEVETLMQAIDLCDIVCVEKAAPGAKSQSVKVIYADGIAPEAIAPQDNLACKACELVREQYGIKDYFDITIEKHIPIAAGLGGGSADAAAVAAAISEMYGLDSEEMFSLCRRLGTDVAFCYAAIRGKPAAIGRGRGELLEFVTPTDARVSLKRSDIKIPNKTASVYGSLKKEDYLVKYNIGEFLKASCIEEKKKHMGNALKAPLERITQKHEELFLCGAGPTYYSIGETGEYKLLTGDDIMKKRIGVFFGGKSGEHEVSRVSATTVITALDKEKYDVVTIGITKQGEWLLYDGPTELIAPGEWEEYARNALAKDPQKYSFSVLGQGNRSLADIIDFALPIMHGPNGEDGTIQGVFELLNIPYAGAGVAGCSVTMDKIIAKEVFDNAGLKQSPYVAFTSSEIGEALEKKINDTLEYPLFIKPANMGSSVGITKVSDPSGLGEAIRTAAKYDSRMVAEHGINAREIEIAVMGNDELVLGSIGEIVPAAEFYDYDAKYNDDNSKLLIPAPITKEQEEEVREMAKKAYRAAACCGFSRVDFLMDKESGELYINEINAIPGFTSISMFPMLMMRTGMSMHQLIDRIIELGYERYNLKNNRQDA